MLVVRSEGNGGAGGRRLSTPLGFTVAGGRPYAGRDPKKGFCGTVKLQVMAVSGTKLLSARSPGLNVAFSSLRDWRPELAPVLRGLLQKRMLLCKTWILIQSYVL